MKPTAKPYELTILEAAALAHRTDVRELSGRIERLVAVLREHGIPMPEEDPRLGASDGEHLEACRRVVVAAYDLLECERELTTALAELRSLVGSGMELVGGESWR